MIFTRWKVLFGLGLLYGMLAITTVPFARADTIYDYTGEGMTVLKGTCSAQPCIVTAAFDLSTPLPSNYNNFFGLPETPVSYTMSAGSLTLTNSNSSLLSGTLEVYSTDSAGDPTTWIFAATDAAGELITSNNVLTADFVKDGSFVAGNLCDAGTWSTGSSAVPEPTSLILLGAGILGLAGVARRTSKVALT